MFMKRTECAVVFILLVAVLALSTFVGCDARQSSHPPAKFGVSQTVTIGQTGEKVVVIDSWYRGDYSCWMYECRVASPIQRNNDGLFSRDTDITRYALVWFKEFELRQ